MRRSELMIEGELRWHEEFSQVVSQAWAGPPAALTAGAENGAVQAGRHRPEPPDKAAPASARPSAELPASAEQPAGAKAARAKPAGSSQPPASHQTSNSRPG
jgi:hypothetical protein